MVQELYNSITEYYDLHSDMHLYVLTINNSKLVWGLNVHIIVQSIFILISRIATVYINFVYLTKFSLPHGLMTSLASLHPLVCPYLLELRHM